MIRLPLLLIAMLLFVGCVNKRGISATYYNDCKEYYDMHGYYHKECDKNIIEYEDVGKLFEGEDPNANAKVR